MNVAAPSITGDSCHISSTATANAGRRKECTFAEHEHSHCSDKLSFVKLEYFFSLKLSYFDTTDRFRSCKYASTLAAVKPRQFCHGKACFVATKPPPIYALPKEEKEKQL